MRVLVTGAGGQLGQALRHELRGHDLQALTRAECDITDFDTVRGVLASFRPAVVVNAAAWNDVDGAETHVHEAYRVNAVGTRNLAVCAAEHGAAILHVSTDFVFDGRAGRPYHEYDRTGPLSVYGASKLAGEEAVRSLHPRHYIVRTAWLFSPWRDNFPLRMLRRAAQGPVRVVADRRGSPTYAPHLARAVARLLGTGAWGTYHLAGGGEASWYEAISRLFARLGIRTAIEPAAAAEFPSPAPRPACSPLITIQEPRILLPPWEEGIDALAVELARG